MLPEFQFIVQMPELETGNILHRILIPRDSRLSLIQSSYLMLLKLLSARIISLSFHILVNFLMISYESMLMAI